MSKVHTRGPAPLRANLTPMIDVTFLLIVFFVLVSQIVEVEHVDLRLPELVEPRTDLPGDEARAVINVVPGARGRAESYRLGTRDYPANETGAEQLETAIGALLQANPSLRLNLRADQRTHFDAVEPVLRAVAGAGRSTPGGSTPPINLVVVREE